MIKKILLIVLVILCLISHKACGQEVSIGIDPGVLDEGIDVTASANADLNIFRQNFIVGLAFEWFPELDYFSYHGTLDYPLWFSETIETRIGIEYGHILRSNLITHKGYPENGTSTFGFRTYGFNGQVCYWFNDHFGAYATLNYKYRYDNVYVWEDAATEWEYSVRTGIKYRF